MSSTEALDLGVIFHEHETLLHSIALKLCHDPMEAGDLVQDTFERALRHASHHEINHPRAWLITVMRNLFLDRCRARNRGPQFESIDDQLPVAEPDPDPSPTWASISPAQLQAAITRLDDKFRRVYELHTLEGASYDQIARILSIPRNTVGTRLARARQKLREFLCAQLEEADHDSNFDHDHTP